MRRARSCATFSLVAILCAGPTAAEEPADVIVLTDGATEAVAAEVESLGGLVRLRYQGVPALAARVPATRIPELRRREGVLAVEKDQVLALEDPLPASRAERLRRLGLDGLRLDAREARAFDPQRALAVPSTYLNYLTSGAVATWAETGFGEGSIVAVVDTGTNPVVPCLADGQVIGAPGFPLGFDSYADNPSGGNPATAPDNDPHGTWVGGVIASHCVLLLPEKDEFSELDELVAALQLHAPGLLIPDTTPGTWILPLFGIAPKAQIYPVKVFPQKGGGTPVSEVLQGLDHLLELKRNGALDVDVLNMSLSGPTLFDGRTTFDRFVGELRKVGILVVAAAGNSGPVPNTVGSPATSFSALSVGAVDDVFSSRVIYEWLGLVAPGFGPGQGFVMRPDAETRIANFSSRGPLSDGRVGPLISALGTWNFVQDPSGFFAWVAGTSFASPTVAGAGALLNAFWEAAGRETSPCQIRNALLLGADRERVGEAWRGLNDQGLGVLNVPAALDLLKQNRRPPGLVPLHECDPVPAGRLEANVLGHPRCGHRERFTSDLLDLFPAQVRDFVFEIDESTSRVEIELEKIRVPDNSASAVFPNALEVNVQSAKRSAVSRPVQEFFEAPQVAALGGSLEIEIEDGEWTLAGAPIADQPMEPGLMKLSLAGDFVNQSSVEVRARITRENFKDPLRHPRSRGVIRDDEIVIIPVWVRKGTSRATFDLEWKRDWSRFPTSDIDLLLVDPVFNLITDAATLNAPERATVDSPTPGLWFAVVVGFEVPKRDRYRLFVRVE